MYITFRIEDVSERSQTWLGEGMCLAVFHALLGEVIISRLHV